MNDDTRISTDYLCDVCNSKRATVKKGKQIKRLNKSLRIYNFTKLYEENISLFRNYLKDQQHNEEMSTALNEYRENLIHLACQYNEPRHIKQLITLKCPIFKQDFYGRTPLHVAIQREHMECVEEFVRLLKSLIDLNGNYDPDTKELIENLIKMFRVYNHDGYTVLHLAVLKNLRHVVMVMLVFCLKFKINVLESEVLGSGDSILHLAVKHNFNDIKNIIIDKIKESVNYPNYSGATPDKYSCDEEVKLES